MIATLLWIIFYAAGYWLAFSMLRIEHASENNTYTKGDRILGIVLSVLSWIMVLWMLGSTWVDKINKTGYWNRPVIEEKEVEIVEVKEVKKPTRNK